MAMLYIKLNIVEFIQWCDDKITRTCPKNHKKKLEKDLKHLKRIKLDVTRIFKEQERSQPRTECKAVVKRWLEEVNDIDEEVNTQLKKLAKSSSCTCCCFPHPNYDLGKEVRLIDKVHSLVEEGKKFEDDKDLVRSTDDPIINIPDHSTIMVGREGKSAEIQGYLSDSQVTTIGIWGMGGIGKTTMLKSIKQWLSENDHGFHYIIWIEMFQNEDDILKIQKQIANCIPPVKYQHEERENAENLRIALQNRKSLVLIDNVWKKLDFERIGIPFAMGATVVKILFTTWSERVCDDMMQGLEGKKIVRLDSLDEKESLQLFKKNISPHVDLNDKFVCECVEKILKKCGGLPLVIEKVARTVTYYDNDVQWNHAVECLRSYKGKFLEDLQWDHVMERLKLNYDNLEDPVIKSCLLYLSLYPEGYQIYTDLLIKEWVADGFLDTPNDNSFTGNYIRGVQNINTLKSNCLVEKSVYSDHGVKLHDVIRQMLCWIRKHENEEVFKVYYDEISDCNYDGWDSAKRISLLEGQLKGLPENGMPSCLKLTNLLVTEDYDHQIDKLPTEFFFHSTPSLRVLNLSGTGLVDIPKSIGALVELRYLNLNGTRIHTVPMELANLKKLKWLDLGDTKQLVTIVGSAISRLSALQSLNLFNTSYQWQSDDVNMTTLLKLEDLRELKKLEDLSVDLSLNSHLDTILRDEMFLKSIARISFIRIDFTTSNLGGLQLMIELISMGLPKLKDLIVNECTLATDILETGDTSTVTQLRLRRLEIIGCQRLKELSWTARIPSLEELIVGNCNNVRELIEEEEEIREERRKFPMLYLLKIKELILDNCNSVNELVEEEREEEIRENRRYFPKLRRLEIKDLNNLERIHGRSTLLFPALRVLLIQNCPNLKKLSFGDDSAKNLECIKCRKTQRDSLEWENKQIQAKFLPYFRASLQ